MTLQTCLGMNDRQSAQILPHLPEEAAGLRFTVSPSDLLAAQQSAEKSGVGVDEVLLARGQATSDSITLAAAHEYGAIFDPLDEEQLRPPVRMAPEHVAGLLCTGLLQRPDGSIVAATRGHGLRQLLRRFDATPHLASRIHLSTPERLAAFVRRHFEPQLAWLAAESFRHRHPHLCAGTLGVARHVLALLILAAIILFVLPTLPSPAEMPLLAWAGALILSAMLLGGCVFKLAACMQDPLAPPPPFPDDEHLPRYSLIVPLYREARVVPQIAAALEAIDYPREKLQVLFTVEPDDRQTIAALEKAALRPGFEIAVATSTGPRTKPKAMNAVLPFARGDIIGVYDAEDVPDPLQLRRACSILLGTGGRRIGCVQARLAIDNLADSWITRQFAAEYATHFDVVLPMLATCGLPLPLGGTSNHFRREALEKVGGWDPFNVTEDADLGVRLARAGWRTAVINSTTDEEAPRTFGAWMRQRTRWYKGWMQTLLVHSRQPRELGRTLGAPGVLTLGIIFAGGITAALLHPFLVFFLLLDWWHTPSLPTHPAVLALEGGGFAVMAIGYFSAALSTALGMRRRRIPGLWRVLPLIPVYWLMMSAAAWRALLQLVVDPYQWEKTDHGLAVTSRRQPRIIRRAGRGATWGKAARGGNFSSAQK